MEIKLALVVLRMPLGALMAAAQGPVKRDVIKISADDLELPFIGHGSLMMGFGGKIIHVDSCRRVVDYTKFPKAELIHFIRDHPDHFDQPALEAQEVRLGLVWTV
ncbi:MAG: hypothetical protein ABIJ50_03285 [Pseudomonadota bacterium]